MSTPWIVTVEHAEEMMPAGPFNDRRSAASFAVFVEAETGLRTAIYQLRDPLAEMLEWWEQLPEDDEEPVDERPVEAVKTVLDPAPVEAWETDVCDADAATIYRAADGAVRCDCVVCARCGKHTGNFHQGHYWSRCKKATDEDRWHFCCPNDCELEAARRQPELTEYVEDGVTQVEHPC